MKRISPAALSAFLTAGNIHDLLDVRTPPEYASAHVPGANLIPLNELKVGAYLAQHMPGTPIYVVCEAGARAMKAIEQFERAGCGDCVLVEGGMQSWRDAGLPMLQGVNSVLPILRQVQIVIGSLAIVSSVLAIAVDRWFAVLPLFLGGGLVIAGATGTCGMAVFLARMPWNRGRETHSPFCTTE